MYFDEPKSGTVTKRTIGAKPKAVATPAVVGKPAPARKRSRLDPQAREKMILEGATIYFARHGFASQTKDLAAELGVSQGLIFRYFGTKQHLVECVYQNVFLRRWSSKWERAMRDRRRPLQERLEAFYLSYFEAIDDNAWIRVSLYAGLSGSDIISRYIRGNVDKILRVIALELRVESAGAQDGPVDPMEYEVAWHLHSTFIYALIRKYVHGVSSPEDPGAFVKAIVHAFLHGAGRAAPPSGRVRPRA